MELPNLVVVHLQVLLEDLASEIEIEACDYEPTERTEGLLAAPVETECCDHLQRRQE